jgi:hypothetical protein
MQDNLKNSVIYIARDIERALGIEPSANYFIVTNDSPYARSIKEKYPDFILLVESPIPLDTFELLEKEETADFIKNKSKEQRAKHALDSDREGKNEEKREIEKPNVLVFKNTARIEEFFAKKGWWLLNPPSALAEKIENKITQVEWLCELAELLPSFKIAPAKEIKWQKKPLVLQWAHAHTGEGTIVINDGATLVALQKKFPDRPAKASEFIKGPTFTVNVAVTSGAIPRDRGSLMSRFSRRLSTIATGLVPGSTARVGENFQQTIQLNRHGAIVRAPEALGSWSLMNDIAIGNPSYQITGMPTLTDSPFATVGNDWSLPHTLLNERHLEDLRGIAEKVGTKMRESGWKGLFGIDVIYDEERDQWKLIEINARQPASTTFESQLQSKFRGHGLVGSNIFEAHLAALTDSPLTEKQIEINDGAQLVQRVTKTVVGQMVEMSQKTDTKSLYEMSSWQEKIAELNKAGYITISYPNKKPNSDFLRIQSDKGLLEKHGKWNARGEKIIEILEE